jgi:hypothetical protein
LSVNDKALEAAATLIVLPMIVLFFTQKTFMKGTALRRLEA